jgi:hypothetical protein
MDYNYNDGIYNAMSHMISTVEADVQTKQQLLGTKMQPTWIQFGIQIQHGLPHPNPQCKLGDKKGGTQPVW